MQAIAQGLVLYNRLIGMMLTVGLTWHRAAEHTIKDSAAGSCTMMAFHTPKQSAAASCLQSTELNQRIHDMSRDICNTSDGSVTE